MRSSTLFSAALLVAVSIPARAECEAADAEALRWLDRMSHSLRETSYSGVFTYQHGGSMQTMRISHSVENNVEYELVTRLTGQGVQVVRAEHPLDCVHPGHKLVRLGDLYQRNNRGCGISSFYRLQMAGAVRVAGRSAVMMNVLPRDRYRYGYQMALDRETGLLLKTQTLNEGGQVLERFQFADVTIGAVDGEGTRVEHIHEAAHVHGVKRPPMPASSSPWSVQWLPDGFMMTDDVDNSSYNRTYTDGLATFSVFVEEMEALSQPGAGEARQGGTMAYTRGLLISGKPALVTVLGEVPINTARRVADSVAWVAATGQ